LFTHEAVDGNSPLDTALVLEIYFRSQLSFLTPCQQCPVIERRTGALQHDILVISPRACCIHRRVQRPKITINVNKGVYYEKIANVDNKR